MLGLIEVKTRSLADVIDVDKVATRTLLICDLLGQKGHKVSVRSL